MARIITDPYGREIRDDPTLMYHLYAGLDCLGTRQAFDVIHPQLTGQSLALYDAAMMIQQPCLAMSLRGIAIDERERKAAVKRIEQDEAAAIAYLNEHPKLKEVWDVAGPRPQGSLCENHPSGVGRHNWTPRGGSSDSQVCKHCGCSRLVTQLFNPHSSPQCAHLLYDLLGFKRVYSKKYNNDGSRLVTTDAEAIEKCAQRYPDHVDLLDRILTAKTLHKELTVVQARLDDDGRWRSSFNVCAAETGRMSSSKSPYRRGGNSQNVADKNRGIFVTDPGLVLWYADLEQADSKIVAHTSECPQDIADHESGNTHIGLGRTLFPDALRWELEGANWEDPAARAALPWCLDKERGWPIGRVSAKQICAQPLPWKPEHDYYRIAKVVRHGTNIGMSPVGLQRQIHSDRKTAQRLHEGYFERYPENLRRQLELRRQVREEGRVVGPLGNVRTVLGRLWEDDVQRKLLAQVQQSTVAWMINVALWRIWYEFDGRLNLGNAPKPSDPNRVWLLAQVHDAIVGLCRPGDLGAMRRVKQILETPVLINGRPVTIKAEVQWGRSWSHADLEVVKL